MTRGSKGAAQRRAEAVEEAARRSQARRVRVSDVHRFRARYRAVAECDYVAERSVVNVTHGRCQWTFIPHPWEPDADVRKAAQQHVREFVGHEVVVTVRDVTRYYLPNDLVAELRASTDVGDVADPGTNPEELRED